MSNIVEWPSKFTKNDVRREFGADGVDRRSVWKYGDYNIWFLHLSKQRPSGGWTSTAENGRINIWYQDKKDALVIEMLGDNKHGASDGRLTLVFASPDENSQYEFKGVFECIDTDDGVIDHVYKRISKGFDIDTKKPL